MCRRRVRRAAVPARDRRRCSRALSLRRRKDRRWCATKPRMELSAPYKSARKERLRASYFHPRRARHSLFADRWMIEATQLASVLVNFADRRRGVLNVRATPFKYHVRNPHRLPICPALGHWTRQRPERSRRGGNQCATLNHFATEAIRP